VKEIVVYAGLMRAALVVLMRNKMRSMLTVAGITIAIAVVFLFGPLFSSSARGQTLKQIAKFDLPGPGGKRFDYLTIDDEDQFLLSAPLGPGILYVIDMRTNKVVKAIPGLPGITGLEFVPGTRKVYTSDWGEEKIGIVDLHSMTVLKRLATAAKPNGSAYATPFRKMYVSNTLGKAVTVVDVDKDEIVKTMEFASETGMPQYDSSARRVYVNLRNTNEVAEIDPATDTVLARYPVDGCQFNHGMAVDSEHHRAFVLCNGNRTFTVFALDIINRSHTFQCQRVPT
jgi:DNA-binding beta-propeller fold protein YncE